MQVGIITPIRYQHLNNSQLHVCYSNFLGSKLYREFYSEVDGLVILDYSPRLPRRPNLEEYVKRSKKIHHSLLVLPSVDYSATRTIELVKEFLPQVNSTKLIGVVQGFDLESLAKCYTFLRENCDVIGLPSPLETIARRDEIARDLGIKEKTIYLEVYSNPYEELPPANSIGICTSFPIRLAADLRRLSEYNPTPPPLNFNKSDLIEELAQANVDEYLEVVRYEGNYR